MKQKFRDIGWLVPAIIGMSLYNMVSSTFWWVSVIWAAYILLWVAIAYGNIKRARLRREAMLVRMATAMGKLNTLRRVDGQHADLDTTGPRV